ncbi:sigma-70 family RNA polymerase sigma factor [Nonomuraea sp. KC401]|uniref:RNA polymerase sigma factor n=1 Tax=unclassified Nonomuraea TaxID=2593643 RepID=UPI0010FE4B5E|nr:sigma-70 family RNA polymerase sigma factor [Nonomuraea sp. KC401]NBE97228.1 sigma-70 family RNA polymerase sigma factor [Nonomuraea sp. K271]TLF65910.1 sigma-70 family RNA polymerase sigma factor [Nonomuraea sp. KC401]
MTPPPRPPTGDDGAEFAQWYRREFPDLLLFAHRLGARWHEAFDLAQEACAKAFPHWPEIGKPRAYLRVAIRNAYFKMSRGVRESELGAAATDTASAGDQELLRVEFQDQERAIFAAIRHLPPVQREIMAWTIDGYTPAEIAELLDKSPPAVRVNLYKARATLRTALTGMGGDDG